MKAVEIVKEAFSPKQNPPLAQSIPVSDDEESLSVHTQQNDSQAQQSFINDQELSEDHPSDNSGDEDYTRSDIDAAAFRERNKRKNRDWVNLTLILTGVLAFVFYFIVDCFLIKLYGDFPKGVESCSTLSVWVIAQGVLGFLSLLSFAIMCFWKKRRQFIRFPNIFFGVARSVSFGWLVYGTTIIISIPNVVFCNILESVPAACDPLLFKSTYTYIEFMWIMNFLLFVAISCALCSTRPAKRSNVSTFEAWMEEVSDSFDRNYPDLNAQALHSSPWTLI